MLDPKAAASMAASALDPKMLAAAGMDPKMFGLDPKTMASLAAMDPKELAKLDPTLAAMYGLPGAPGPSTSTHNGVPKSSPAPGTGRPKPGTVAAALEEKKKAAAAAAEAAEANKVNHEESATLTPVPPTAPAPNEATNNPSEEDKQQQQQNGNNDQEPCQSSFGRIILFHRSWVVSNTAGFVIFTRFLVIVTILLLLLLFVFFGRVICGLIWCRGCWW